MWETSQAFPTQFVLPKSPKLALRKPDQVAAIGKMFVGD
jgi:hypothetical protein